MHCKPIERYREQLMSVRVIPEFYIMVQCAMPVRNQVLSTGQTTVVRDAAPLLMQSPLLQSGWALLSVCISLAIYHRAALCRGNLRVMLGYYRNTATTTTVTGPLAILH